MRDEGRRGEGETGRRGDAQSGRVAAMPLLVSPSLSLPVRSSLITSREEDVHVVVVVECALREPGGDERRVVEVDGGVRVRLPDEIYQFRRQVARVVRGEDVGRLGDAVVRHRPDVHLTPVLVVEVRRGGAAAPPAPVFDGEAEGGGGGGPGRGGPGVGVGKGAGWGKG